MINNNNYSVCFISPYINAYIDPGSDEAIGGAERQQYILAKKMSNEGHDISFITFSRGGPSEEWIGDFRILQTLPVTNSPSRSPYTIYRLLKGVRKADSDIYYFRGNPQLAILASFCCKLLNRHTVYCVANDSNVNPEQLQDHHPMFEKKLFRKLYVQAIRSTDGVVAQTEAQKEALSQNYAIESTVIPNSYPVPPVDSLSPSDKRKYVTWIGSLDKTQKQPEMFLRLARKIPEIPFLMIGSTHDSDYYNEIATGASTISNLEFEGYVRPDRIDDYINKSRILINTSQYEGFPNTYLEAWRFAVPVIALHHTLDGALEKHEMGIHARSFSELVRHTRAVYFDFKKLNRLGLNGRQFVKDNCSLDRAYEQYNELFAKL